MFPRVPEKTHGRGPFGGPCGHPIGARSRSQTACKDAACVGTTENATERRGADVNDVLLVAALKSFYMPASLSLGEDLNHSPTEPAGAEQKCALVRTTIRV